MESNKRFKNPPSKNAYMQAIILHLIARDSQTLKSPKFKIFVWNCGYETGNLCKFLADRKSGKQKVLFLKFKIEES